jgi:serine/threonine protein phosphatase PrpC
MKNFLGKSNQGKNEFGQYKINQDSFFVRKVFNEIENFYIFGVFDGHGKKNDNKGLNGHYISSNVKQSFLRKFTNPRLYVNNPMDIKKIKETEIYNKLVEDNYKIIFNSFKEAEQELIHNVKYDVNFSGTTAIFVILIHNKVICANCGDSRAFLARDKRSLNSPLTVLIYLPK